MNNRRFPHSALLACGLLLVLGAVPCVLGGLVWREWQQERLDRALIVAVKRRDAAATALLLRHGANVDAQNCQTQSFSWGQVLQTRRPVRSSTGNRSSTALLLAVQGLAGQGAPSENIPLVRILLDSGADINATDENDMTALMSAAAYGHAATVKLLLDREADVRPKDKGFMLTTYAHGRSWPTPIAGRSALQYVSEMNEDTTILHLLLDHGADVNVRDGYEQTLLISAASGGSAEKIRLLLAYHADLHLRDQWGRTALMQARDNGYSEITTLLQQAGATE